MKIIIDIGHPAHIHFFKNIIKSLKSHGHEILITARDTDIIKYLLNKYEFDFIIIGKHSDGILRKALGLFSKDYNLFRVARNFQPDIFVGIGNEYISQIAFLMKKPAIVFTDTEEAKLTHTLTCPFASVICTPKYFKKNFGKKHVRMNGYKEIAYLHPDYFSPCSWEDLNLVKDEKIIVVRFISWGAAHDLSLKGIDTDAKKRFINTLTKYGKVLITSEKPLEGDLEKYRVKIPPEKMHSLLYYAQLYIGEGGTMAAETAILGTPAIHIESTSDGKASGELYGNFVELRDRYGLLSFYATHEEALNEAIKILTNPDSKNEWRKKREHLMNDVIDVTAWMTEFIEQYPESYFKYKINNKDSQ